MWHFGIWFSKHGGVGLTVGLDDLRGLFQPMILWFSEWVFGGHMEKHASWMLVCYILLNMHRG